MTLRRMNFSLVLAGLVAMTACGGPNSFGIAKKSAQELTVVSDADLCYAQRFWRSPQMMQEIARRKLDCSANVAEGKNQPTPPAARQAQAAKSDKRVFTDPHEYCRAVIRSDDPLDDARYKGPKATEQMAAEFDVPFEETKFIDGAGVVNYKIIWRCANGAVLACYEGNYPICQKADTSQTPTEAMVEWCRAHPNADIPGLVAGHTTIIDWKCAGKRPVVVGRFPDRLDKEGYIPEIWERVPTADNEGQRKPATTAAAATSLQPTPSKANAASSSRAGIVTVFPRDFVTGGGCYYLLKSGRQNKDPIEDFSMRRIFYWPSDEKPTMNIYGRIVKIDPIKPINHCTPKNVYGPGCQIPTKAQRGTKFSETYKSGTVRLQFDSTITSVCNAGSSYEKFANCKFVDHEFDSTLTVTDGATTETHELQGSCGYY